jgi:hypothetical protein
MTIEESIAAGWAWHLLDPGSDHWRAEQGKTKLYGSQKTILTQIRGPVINPGEAGRPEIALTLQREETC